MSRLLSKRTKAEIRDEYIAICNEKGCKFTFHFMDDETLKMGKKLAGFTFVVDEDGLTWVEGGGKRFIAEVVERNQNRYHIIMNGNSYYFSVETPFSFKRKKFLSSLKKESRAVRMGAPMPGKIVDLFVNEGDKISSGDPLLILEAMKMQNEILSEVSGVVTKINIKAGQNVMKDELMIEIQKG
jgi:glutaconyl-CoA/methylmalonyl-CoA decarboxylase subunit gamma